MYPPVQTVAPPTEPVSLSEAKAHLRVDHTDEDTLISSLLDSAIAHLDGWTGILGRCLITQTWRQDYDVFERCMRLPLWPVTSISSITYLDSDEVSTTVTSSNYALQSDALGPYVRFIDDYALPSSLYEAAAVSITFVAGYADADSVPAPIKSAILLLVGHWYEHRQAVSPDAMQELPMAVNALLTPYRRVGV